MIQGVFINVLEISIIASVVTILLFAGSPLLEKKYRAKWSYVIWLLIVIRLIIPFQFTSPSAPIQIDVENAASYSKEVLREIEASQNGLHLQEQKIMVDEKTQLVDYNEVLEKSAMIWIAGLLAFSTYHIVTYLYYIKRIKRWLLICESNQKRILHHVKNRLGMKRDIGFYRCSKVKSPMMFGVIHPTIVIPCIDYSETDLYLILKHECMHYKRHDIEVKILLFLAQAIHWFNPLIHIMAKRFNETIEMICDDYVINGGDSMYKKRYMETLLQSINLQTKETKVFTTNYNGGMKVMKKRFKNIADGGKKRKGFALLIAVVVACLSLNLAISITSNTFANESLSNQFGGQEISKELKGIHSETKPNKELEVLIKKALEIPEEYTKDTKYFYNYVDLNSDNKNDIFVVAMGPYTSGTGGSTGLYIENTENGLQVKQIFTLVRTPLIISDHTTNGYKDIIALYAGGGVEPKYVKLSYENGRYHDINDGTEVKSLKDVKGTAIICDNIADGNQEQFLHL